MKLNFRLFCLLSFLFTNSGFAEAAELQVIVQSVQGQARIVSADGKFAEVRAGSQLERGSQLQTGPQSSVMLKTSDGSAMSVGESSSYSLSEASPIRWGWGQWTFDLLEGSVRALVNKAPYSDRVRFKVRTKSGTIGVRGTEFVVISSRGDTRVINVHGSIWVAPDSSDLSTGSRRVLLQNNQFLRLRPEAFAAAASVPQPLNREELANILREEKRAALPETIPTTLQNLAPQLTAAETQELVKLSPQKKAELFKAAEENIPADAVPVFNNKVKPYIPFLPGDSSSKARGSLGSSAVSSTMSLAEESASSSSSSSSASSSAASSSSSAASLDDRDTADAEDLDLKKLENYYKKMEATADKANDVAEDKTKKAELAQKTVETKTVSLNEAQESLNKAKANGANQKTIQSLEKTVTKAEQSVDKAQDRAEQKSQEASSAAATAKSAQEKAQAASLQFKAASSSVSSKAVAASSAVAVRSSLAAVSAVAGTAASAASSAATSAAVSSSTSSAASSNAAASTSTSRSSSSSSSGSILDGYINSNSSSSSSRSAQALPSACVVKTEYDGQGCQRQRSCLNCDYSRNLCKQSSLGTEKICPSKGGAKASSSSSKSAAAGAAH